MRADIVKIGNRIHDAMLEWAEKNDQYAIQTGDLCGGCAVGSYLLMSELRKRLGIRTKFVATPSHCFVEYQRHIYDITAKQFGRKEKTYVFGKRPSMDYDAVYNLTGSDSIATAYTTRDRYGVDLVNRTWPRGQRPKDYKLRWINQHKARMEYIGPQ